MMRYLPLALCLLCVVGAVAWGDSVRALAADDNTRLLLNFDASCVSIDRDETLPAAKIGGARAEGVHGSGYKIGFGDTLSYPASVLNRAEGSLEFWFKPGWGGDDGVRRVLLQVGSGMYNSMIIEKTERGLLSFRIGDDDKMTAARGYVWDWTPNKWRHIMVFWTAKHQVLLYVDGTLLDAAIATNNDYMEPTAAGTELYIGCSPDGECPADGIFDEFRIRDTAAETGALNYNGWLRGMPLKEVIIDGEPLGIRSDLRVVQGEMKQLGLLGVDDSERVWSLLYFGGTARPRWENRDIGDLVVWTSDDTAIAKVDAEGVVEGVSKGVTTIRAALDDLTAEYKVEVISRDLPDLDVAFIERLPRYDREALKVWPAAGEEVTFRAHVVNRSGVDSKPFEYKWTITEDTFHDMEPGPGDTVKAVEVGSHMKSLAPGEEVVFEYKWPWSSDNHFVRFEADIAERNAELCEVNNGREDATLAQAVLFPTAPETIEAWKSRFSVEGSFSIEDHLQASIERFNQVLAGGVFPCTTPFGVMDRARVDNIVVIPEEQVGEYWEKNMSYYDGWFPIYSWPADPERPRRLSFGLIHDLGHTVTELPDIYARGLLTDNVYITNEAGDQVAGTDAMPGIHMDPRWDSPTVFYASTEGPGGEAATPKESLRTMMTDCFLVLNEFEAGIVQYFAGYRKNGLWNSFRYCIPNVENRIVLYDIYNQPLPYAGIEIYPHTTTGQQWSNAGFVPNCVKFRGATNGYGIWRIPQETAPDYDDPQTDEIEGTIEASNPWVTKLQHAPMTPDVWTYDGVLVLKVTYNGQVEYHFLDMMQFCIEYFRAPSFQGAYPVQTQFVRDPSVLCPPDLQPKPMRGGDVNLRPIAVAPDSVTAKVGEEFILDGLDSSDPDGDKIVAYHWHLFEGEYEPGNAHRSRVTLKAPAGPCELLFELTVSDGIRTSKPKQVKVIVVE